MLTLTREIGCNPKLPVTVCVPYFPSTTALVAVVTVFVATANATVELPAGTVTEGSSDTLALLDESVTFTPPAGASPVRFTEPVVGDPPMTLDGLKVMLARVAVVSVRLAFCEEPLSVAVIVAVDVAVTPVVETVKFAEVEPAGTVTDGAVVAGAPDALRVTVVPPVGAGTPRVTVPEAELPPTTDVGLTVTEARVTA